MTPGTSTTVFATVSKSWRTNYQPNQHQYLHHQGHQPWVTWINITSYWPNLMHKSEMHGNQKNILYISKDNI